MLDLASTKAKILIFEQSFGNCIRKTAEIISESVGFFSISITPLLFGQMIVIEVSLISSKAIEQDLQKISQCHWAFYFFSIKRLFSRKRIVS